MISTDKLEETLKNSKNVDNVLSQIHNMTFTEYFYYLLEKYHLKKSEVINASGLDKSYAYKIIEGTRGNHSKDKIFRLSLAMQVSQQEANHMLTLMNAGALYVQNARDLILLNGLIKKESVMDVNLSLEAHHLKVLE